MHNTAWSFPSLKSSTLSLCFCVDQGTTASAYSDISLDGRSMEQLTDLLAGPRNDQSSDLKIRQDPRGGLYVEGEWSLNRQANLGVCMADERSPKRNYREVCHQRAGCDVMPVARCLKSSGWV
jgi:hypothetical protein